MPLVKSTKEEPIKPYGVGAPTNLLSFQDRLLEKFKPQEYVRVINPDSETFFWQYMPDYNEEYQYTEDGMHRHTRRSEPEVWELGAGETETIVGANAYVMIEALYKKITAKKVLMTPGEPGQARKFNHDNGDAQDYWINKILVGKEVPTFTSINDKVSDEPTKRGPGRPANQTV